MKRDIRKLNRVREAAGLIHRALAGGFVRREVLARNPLVSVLLEKHGKYHGQAGRVLVFFWRESNGFRVSVMSRFLEPRGIKRHGLPQAWAVVMALED